MGKKKKKIIIICSIVGGVLAVAAVVAAILIPELTKVDYTESYALATKLNASLKNFSYYYESCEGITSASSLKNVYPSFFNSDVENCKKALDSSTLELVKKLGDTSGVQGDGEIKEAFDQFSTEYYEIFSNDNVEEKLDIYNKWANFVYNASLGLYTTADEVNTYADYAINSGNDTLKAFGEAWKEKALEVVEARKTYPNYSKDEILMHYDMYVDKADQLSQWFKENLPDITQIIPLNFKDDYDFKDAWKTVLDLIYTKFVNNFLNNPDRTANDYQKIIDKIIEQRQ